MVLDVRGPIHRLRRWARGGVGKVRRYYLSHFDHEYMERMKAMREGDCHRCGYCCRIFFQCPHLDGENHCTIYDRRYLQCRTFPIDHRDLSELAGICGYQFNPSAAALVRRQMAEGVHPPREA
ncbi:MAG: hypothetical protein HY722_05715 [Planctomycetes bacterium]|nr:hypothetical protein [Planctomycetota bacterium]